MKASPVALSTIMMACVLSLNARVVLSADATPTIVGRYVSQTETDVAAGLVLFDGGTAQHTLTVWDGGAVGKVEFRDTAFGHWKKDGNAIVVTFSRYGVSKTIEYEMTPCLRYDPYRSSKCSFGLRSVRASMPSIYTWSLWNPDAILRDLVSH